MFQATSTRSRPTPGALVEFKAGKMNLKGRMVYPDNRKGLCFIRKTPTDSLVHFHWKDRETGLTEDDFIIFPNDFEFIKVNQCTTGRVYLLKGLTSSQRHFYWLQEPKTDKDDEICRQVNDILNDPFSFSTSTDSDELDGIINNMSPQELLHLYTALKQFFKVNLSSEKIPLQSPTLNEIRHGNSDTISTSSNVFIDLSNSIQRTTEAIRNIVMDPRKVKLLSKYLPRGDIETSLDENILNNISSPHFQYGLSLFCIAFQEGKLGPILKQFDLPPDALEAAELGDMFGFVVSLDKLKNSR